MLNSIVRLENGYDPIQAYHRCGIYNRHSSSMSLAWKQDMEKIKSKNFLPSVKDWPTETLLHALTIFATSKHEQAPRAYAMVKAELKLRFGKFANKRPNGG